MGQGADQSLSSAQVPHDEGVEMGRLSTKESADARRLYQNITMGSGAHARASKDLDFRGDVDANSLSAQSDGAASSDGAQAGVKNIEAVAMTWTRWGLIAAYARSVRP